MTTASTTVTVPNGLLYVVDEGAGPPVVLLHAGVADLRSWDAVTAVLVDRGVRVIRYDERGYGASTTEDVEYSATDDLVAVLDARGVGRALLVGNSRGGHAAIVAALDEPDRVVGVVAVGSGISGYDPEPSPLEDSLFAEMDRLEAADPPDAEAIAELDVRVWVDGPGQRADRVAASIREHVREVDLAVNAPGHVSGRRARPDVDVASRLPQLQVPVVMVAGELDVSESVVTAQYVAGLAPRARAVVWPDVAHMIGMEAPERLAGVVLDLVDEIGTWS